MAEDPQGAQPPSDQDPPPATPEPDRVLPTARPRPAYGELAPEGWSWKPESDTGSGSGNQPTSDQRTTGVAPAAPQAASPSGSLPGVPHNLGAGVPKKSAPKAASVPGSASGTTQGPGNTAQQTESGAPYRAAPPAAPQQIPAPQAPAVGPAGRPDAAPKNRTADRVITIILLALGAFTTLSISSAFFALESQLRITGAMVGIEDTTVASWVGPFGTISGIVVLALFALTLIYSIRRLRAGQLTFWVPLTAGAIAVLLVLIVPTIAMLSGAPEIMQQLEADPNGAMDQMFEYMQQMQ